MDDYSNLSLDACEEVMEEKCVTKPTELRIWTITATAKIVSRNKDGVDVMEEGFIPINLQKLWETIDIDKERGPIMSVEYVDNPIRGYDRHAKKRKKRKPVKKNDEFLFSPIQNK